MFLVPLVQSLSVPRHAASIDVVGSVLGVVVKAKALAALAAAALVAVVALVVSLVVVAVVALRLPRLCIFPRAQSVTTTCSLSRVVALPCGTVL